MSYIVVLSALLIAVSFIYRYLNRNCDYWAKRGVKGPKPWPLAGNLLMVRFRPMNSIELEMTEKFGKIYGIFSATQPVLTVNDPELIKLILVKDFHVFQNRRPFNTSHEILDKTMLYSRDEEWKRLRSIASGVFTGAKLKKLMPLITECVEDFCKSLDKCVKKQKDIDLKHLCGSYTMDVIARCGFATKINAYDDRNNPFLRSVMTIMRPTFLKLFAFFIFPKFLLNLFNIKTMLDNKSNQFLFDLSRELLNKRRKNNEFHNDLLQLLMDTERDNKWSVGVTQPQNQIKDSSSLETQSTKLTDTEIIAQSWLFLLAGYETTSTGLTFCLYELALNPDVQQTLYDELQTVIDQKDRFDFEELWKLPYLEAVINESLRLYPPFMRVEREVRQDYELGHTGIRLTAGQLIHISIYAVHHNPEFFPEPEKFDPNRFMPENKDHIIPYSYIPFAAGPRNCIASRLALMEMKACVARVVTRFRLTVNPRTHIPPKFLRLTHVCSSEPLLISMTER